MSGNPRNVGLVRALSILRQLEAGGRYTLDRLAREYHVSTRTIYRDLLALEAAGVPIDHSSNRQKGDGPGAHSWWWVAFRPRSRSPRSVAALDPVDGIDTS